MQGLVGVEIKEEALKIKAICLIGQQSYFPSLELLPACLPWQTPKAT